ncbi:MAG: MATE family efflux transporter [Clostridia bacterium]|nr:MATE family efflux transporter [Clostridia bacterium]
MAVLMRKKDVDMTQGNIFKQILAFAIPMAVGLLFQQLYNTVDMIIVGQFAGKQALAAVGGTTTIINTLVGFCSGLATGAGVVVSQYFGNHDKDGVERSVSTSFSLSMILCVIMTVIGCSLSKPMLMLLNTPSDVMQPAFEYLMVYFAGISGLVMYNMLTGIMRAVGDSQRPLIFLIISSVLNIGLDLLFVAVFHWGALGAGVATIISQFISAIMAFVALLKTKADYKINLKKITIDKPMLKKILALGLPGGFQMAITSLSNVFVHSYINAYGTDVMSGYSIHLKLDHFIVVPAQAFALATTTFVGQNFGAGNYKRAHKGQNIALLSSVVVTAVMSVLFYVFARQLSSAFTSESEVLDKAVFFSQTVVPFYFLMALNQNYAGALRGMNKSKTPMFIMLASFVGFRQVMLFIVSKVFPGNLLPIALVFPEGWFIASASLMIAYYLSPVVKKARAQKKQENQQSQSLDKTA